MFRRGPGRLEMCFYAYKNVLEPMGHLGANLVFSILTLNQVFSFIIETKWQWVPAVSRDTGAPTRQRRRCMELPYQMYPLSPLPRLHGTPFIYSREASTSPQDGDK